MSLWTEKTSLLIKNMQKAARCTPAVSLWFVICHKCNYILNHLWCVRAHTTLNRSDPPTHTVITFCTHILKGCQSSFMQFVITFWLTRFFTVQWGCNILNKSKGTNVPHSTCCSVVVLLVINSIKHLLVFSQKQADFFPSKRTQHFFFSKSSCEMKKLWLSVVSSD